LGIETGRLAQLRGTIAFDGQKMTVFIEMIEGRSQLTVREIRGLVPSLVRRANEVDASTLRVEASIANEELLNLARHAGFHSAGAIEFLELSVP